MKKSLFIVFLVAMSVGCTIENVYYTDYYVINNSSHTIEISLDNSTWQNVNGTSLVVEQNTYRMTKFADQIIDKYFIFDESCDVTFRFDDKEEVKLTPSVPLMKNDIRDYMSWHSTSHDHTIISAYAFTDEDYERLVDLN